MTKALSGDFRVRVLPAVSAGSSHREAAERFGVSAASVSRWQALAREQGDPRPLPPGRDRRWGRIEAHREAVLAALCPDKDVTINEVRGALAQKGLTFGFGTIHRVFARKGITRIKDRARH